MNRGCWILLSLFFLVLIAPGGAQSDEIIADLSDHEIELRYSFAGRDLLLFGAIDHEGTRADAAPYDVVVVVRGPDSVLIVRKKEKIAGIWVNQAAMIFEAVPGYYALASSRELTSITSQAVLSENKIGFDNLGFRKTNPNTAERTAFSDGLIRNKINNGLYISEESGLRLMENTLFQARIHFPANVPVGHYQASIYLFRSGELVASQETPLEINKAGFSRAAYTFANEHPALYGALAILIALMAGWIVGILGRERLG